mgnify:CR=1 FL=1|jgi:hypothetical protein
MTLPESPPDIPVHEIPLERFLAFPSITQATVDRWFVIHAEDFQDRQAYHMELATPCDEPSIEGYELRSSAHVYGREGMIIAIDLASGKFAGSICETEFYLDPGHRGRGLGAEMLLKAFATGIKDPLGRFGVFHLLSPDGLRCRHSAHRKAVQRSLEAGLYVPEEVLVDYPALTGSKATARIEEDCSPQM